VALARAPRRGPVSCWIAVSGLDRRLRSRVRDETLHIVKDSAPPR
jgi:hypothetical protein